MNRRNSVAVLLVLISKVLLVFLQYLPSPLAPALAADLSVSFVAIGMLMSICTVASGFSPILASMMTDRVGALRTWSMGTLCSAAGMVAGALLSDVRLLMVAYALHGMAVGFSVCLLPVLVAQWIPPRQHSLAMSISLALHNLFVSLSYILPESLMAVLGTWQRVTLLFAGCQVFAALALFLLAKKGIDAELRRPQTDGRPHVRGAIAEMGIVRALRRRSVLALTAMMTCFIWCNNTTSTYFPTYLMDTLAIDAQQAGAITAFISTTAIIGALTIGALGRRVHGIGMILLPVLTLVGGLGMYLAQEAQAVMLFAGVFGFAYQGWMPIAITVLLSLPNADGAELAGATALFDGVGHILTLLIPIVAGVLLLQHSMQQSMLLLQLPLVAAVGIALLFHKDIRWEESLDGV